MSEQSQALAPRRYTADDAHELGLPSPDAMNLLDIFAKQMTGSVFLPKTLASHPANILGVVLTGREMSFSPMQSLRMFWVSPDGRIAMYADAMMAAMRRKGFTFPEKEFTAKRATLTAVRPDGETYTAEFTWEDAASAGLTGKDNYKKYPKAMLRARVIAEVYRFLAADLGGAQMYTREEIEDVDASMPSALDEVEVQVVSPVGIKPEPIPEPAPAPEPQAAPPTLDERIEAILRKIGGDHKDAAGVLASYFKGFLAAKRLPAKESGIYAVPLEKLEAVIGNRLEELKSDPYTFGEHLAGRVPTLTAAAKHLGWPADLMSLAEELRQELNHTPEQFLNYLNFEPKPGISMAKMHQDDLRVFFPLFKAVRGTAWAFAELASSQNHTIAETVMELVRQNGRPLDKWDVDFAESILNDLKPGAQDAEGWELK